jgi:uncharacterized protein
MSVPLPAKLRRRGALASLPIIEVETHALLLRKLGRVLARKWLLIGGLPVIPALPEEEDRAREIVARHSDKDWTPCDAISFAVLDVRGVRRAFTFDRHFLQYGRFDVLGLSLRHWRNRPCSSESGRRPSPAGSRSGAKLFTAKLPVVAFRAGGWLAE